MTSIAQAIQDGAARLAGITDNPRLEARILLAHALGLTRNDLIRDPGRVICTATFYTLIERRVAREPLAHLTGCREFWSMSFQVSPVTLIPRPDSETLIEAALDFFAECAPPRRIVDLGTGTGCLLLAALAEFPDAFGIGIDIVPEAASLARTNAVRLGFANRAAFLAGDWTNSLLGRFDLVISNPPYIPTTQLASLMPEVGLFEPSSALDGGKAGYDAYRAILRDLHHILAPGGAAILELGAGQATYVTELASVAGFEWLLRRDLAEIPRAAVLTWPSQ